VSARYDTIGRGYSAHRRTDPRFERRIHSALGDAATVVNVGAGTGSYEPDDRMVVAVEPSSEMLRQRTAGAAPAVQGAAEHLPLRDGAFDVALAVLTVHHWHDLRAGCAELRRVAERAVVLSFEPIVGRDFWLLEYVPEIGPLDATAPSVAEVVDALGGVTAIETLPVPHDCADGFLGGYWRRPDAYLDPAVRAGMSGFTLLAPDAVERGIARLRADLETGRWRRRHADLLARDELDLGYRLLVG
jgi:SAM-dependent methyltransferase